MRKEARKMRNSTGRRWHPRCFIRAPWRREWKGAGEPPVQILTIEGLRQHSEEHAEIERQAFLVERTVSEAFTPAEKTVAIARIFLFATFLSVELRTTSADLEKALEGLPEEGPVREEHREIGRMVEGLSESIESGSRGDGFEGLSLLAERLIQRVREHIVREEQLLYALLARGPRPRAEAPTPPERTAA